MIYKHLIAFFFIIVRTFSNIFHNVSYVTPYKEYFMNLNLIVMIMGFQNK